jgi:hypothetical protein
VWNTHPNNVSMAIFSTKIFQLTQVICSLIFPTSPVPAQTNTTSFIGEMFTFYCLYNSHCISSWLNDNLNFLSIIQIIVHFRSAVSPMAVPSHYNIIILLLDDIFFLLCFPTSCFPVDFQTRILQPSLMQGKSQQFFIMGIRYLSCLPYMNCVLHPQHLTTFFI